MDAGDAEAEVVLATVGGQPTAAGAAAAAGKVAPGAAADDAVAFVRAQRIGAAGQGFAMAVEAPFPDVAEHVVEAPGIGGLEAGGLGGLAGIVMVPADLGQALVAALFGFEIFTIGQGGGGAGAAGVFPLGFGGQGEFPALGKQGFLARLGGELGAEVECFLPTDVFHRVHRAAEFAGVVLHHQQPLGLGDFGAREQETAGDLGINPLFVGAAAGFVGRAAHAEAARLHRQHFQAGEQHLRWVLDGLHALLVLQQATAGFGLGLHLGFGGAGGHLELLPLLLGALAGGIDGGIGRCGAGIGAALNLRIDRDLIFWQWLQQVGQAFLQPGGEFTTALVGLGQLQRFAGAGWQQPPSFVAGPGVDRLHGKPGAAFGGCRQFEAAVVTRACGSGAEAAEQAFLDRDGKNDRVALADLLDQAVEHGGLLDDDLLCRRLVLAQGGVGADRVGAGFKGAAGALKHIELGAAQGLVAGGVGGLGAETFQGRAGGLFQGGVVEQVHRVCRHLALGGDAAAQGRFGAAGGEAGQQAGGEQAQAHGGDAGNARIVRFQPKSGCGSVGQRSHLHALSGGDACARFQAQQGA